MNKKTLKILTLGTLFTLCSCSGLATSSSNEPQSTPISSSTPLAEYTVTWVVDGETSTETYLEGETPVYKYGTEKEADAVYTYTFIGWDKEIVPVVADVTYTAVYEKDYVDYVVTWVVEGVETQEEYHYNDMPSYKDGTPEKEGNAQYSYTFTGWSPELVAVTANATYTATFDPVTNDSDMQQLYKLFSGKKLLLVDDNEINREIAITILEDAGFLITEAKNGKEAFDIIANSSPDEYAAVLMDVQMPVMNGYEATQAIRQLTNSKLASIPIVAMTANAFEEDKKHSFENGMNGHIAKPIDLDNLFTTLKNVIV